MWPFYKRKKKVDVETKCKEDFSDQLVLHRTKKGRPLWGWVVNCTSAAVAYLIDPYAFKKGNGWFIRKEHKKKLDLFMNGHVDQLSRKVTADEKGTFDEGKLVKHITKKGKSIEGFILNGVTKALALQIDPYTFWKCGGWFIRKKHIDILKKNYGYQTLRHEETEPLEFNNFQQKLCIQDFSKATYASLPESQLFTFKNGILYLDNVCSKKNLISLGSTPLLNFILCWLVLQSNPASEIMEERLKRAQKSIKFFMDEFIETDVTVRSADLSINHLFEFEVKDGGLWLLLNKAHPFYKRYCSILSEADYKDFIKFLYFWGLAEVNTLSQKARDDLEFTRGLIGTMLYEFSDDEEC